MSCARNNRRWAAGLFVFVLPLGLGASLAAAAGEAGRAFDAAPFGLRTKEAGGRAVGVRWAEPRKIRRLIVDFARGDQQPDPQKVRIQYWHRHWDGRPDPILAERGAGGQGWDAMDDWTNGGWKDAETQVKKEGSRWVFTFSPSGDKEFKDLGHPGVTYRKTLKIRLLGEEKLPEIAGLEAITDAVCQPLSVRICFGAPADPAFRPTSEETGRLEAYNGEIVALRAVAGGQTRVDGHQFRLPAGGHGAIEAEVLMAVDPINERYDRAIFTLRSSHRPFSFAADEVARGDRILVDDFGALVVRSDDAISLEGYREARKEFPGRTVYDRVAGAHEQNLSRAWDDMPLRRPMDFVHGLPGDRNAMQTTPNGDVRVNGFHHWFRRPRSPKDSDRKGWEGEWLTLGFGLPDDDLRGGRELKDGYLPQLRTWWLDGPLHYEQLAILDKLDGDLTEVLFNDPTVLLMRLRIVNTSATEKGTARLRLTSHHGQRDKLVVEGNRAIARSGDQPRFRYLIRTGDRGQFREDGDGTSWSLEMAPGEAHEVFVAVPSITLDKEDEIDALARRDFVADSRRLCDFWRKQNDRGTQIDTPEPWLNDFYKSHFRHMLVNCKREADSQRLFPHVGTFHYGVYANESVMMVSDLDRRGHHDLAERCLDSWLEYQGSVMLPGNFKSKDGLFYGVNQHESGGYNKHHGYVMWCMAEHWWFTRDRAWMEQAAAKLVKACDWVTSERKATMVTNEDGSRPIEYGFLPAGGLEDVQDYWYWMGTNTATVWGFDALAAALADFGHPEADRLVREAKAYHDDVVAGFNESRIRAPVVRLRDGTYVPKYPSRLYERGRCVGWIREVLEGSIFLPFMGLVDPNGSETKWIMKDYEDNLYISDSYGYSIPVFDRFWFSRGGFCMQANLLDSPMPYLFRDDIKHYVRTYFNAFVSAFEPGIRMCNEHSLPELGYPAGDQFKTSDESQSTCWLRMMYVHERGGDLYLGQAIPRYWLGHGRSIGIDNAASHYGPLSLRINSRAAEGQIEAIVTPPERNRPKTIYVRLRHPREKPIQSVTVNGQDYGQFDPKKEWIILPGTVMGKQTIVAKY